MNTPTTFPPELLDHLRGSFEAMTEHVAVERFGYTATDDFLNLADLHVRNPDGQYVLEWVGAAWELFKLMNALHGHGLEKHTTIPTMAGLYWYFEEGEAQPRPVMINPERWGKWFKSFSGAEQSWMREGEYLLGPQPAPAAL